MFDLARTLDCAGRTLVLDRAAPRRHRQRHTRFVFRRRQILRSAASDRTRPAARRGRRRPARRRRRIDATGCRRGCGRRRDRTRRAGDRGAREADVRADRYRHKQARGDARCDRRGRGTHQRRLCAAARRRARRCGQPARAGVSHAHAGRAALDAGSAAVFRGRRGSEAFPRRSHLRLRTCRHRTQKHRRRSGFRLRQDAGAQPRTSARVSRRSPGSACPCSWGCRARA